MKKLSILFSFLLLMSVIVPLCSATFSITMDINAEGEEATGNLTAEFDMLINYTSYTVNFTDNSTTTEGITITWWNWNFGDGETSYNRNTTHVYNVNWSAINETIDIVQFSIKLEIENETEIEYDWITKVVSFSRPEEPAEVYIDIPGELIIAMVAVILVIVLVLVVINQVEGVMKK